MSLSRRHFFKLSAGAPDAAVVNGVMPYSPSSVAMQVDENSTLENRQWVWKSSIKAPPDNRNIADNLSCKDKL